MERKITYRRAQDADFTGILKLYNRMYNSKRSVEDFLWLVKRNPAGEAILFIALDGEDVVGMQSLIPYRFVRNGELHLTYKSEDSLVRKDLRGTGIYSSLYRMVHKHTEDVLVWGLTDKKAILEHVGMPSSERLTIAASIRRPGFVADAKGLHHFIAKSLFYSMLYLKSAFTTKKAKSLLELKEISPEEYEQETFQSFMNTLTWSYPEIFFPFMDASYLNWRYSTNPNLDRYEIVSSSKKDGSILICSTIGFKGKSAYWQALYTLPEASIDDIIVHISSVRKRVFESGIKIIHTWLFENNPEVTRISQRFYDSGFLKVRKGLWIVNNSHRIGIDVHDLYFSPQLGIR